MAFDPFGSELPGSKEPEVAAPEEKVGLPAVRTYDTQPAARVLVDFDAEVKRMTIEAAKIKIVQDDPTKELVAQYGLQAKDLRTKIEKIRKHFTEPHLRYKQTVDGLCKRLSDPLEAIEKAMGRLLSNYRQLQENERRRKQAEIEKAQRELQKKVEDEAKAAKEKDQPFQPVTLATPVAPEVAKVTRVEEGSASQKKEWKYEVVDITKVPEEYLKPREVDAKKVKEATKAGIREIAGLIITEDFDTRFRL